MASGQQIRVLVATQSEQAYDILSARDDVQFDIALYTGTIKELIPQVQLAIIDYEDIVQYPLLEADIREALFHSAVHECRSEDFVADPDGVLQKVTVCQPGRMITMPESFCIAFVSYSGGTGRTTLALDTALYYAELCKKRAEKSKRSTKPIFQRELPCMLLEMTYGISSLISITGLEMSALMQLATDPETKMQSYRGIDMVPMDYENVRMLATDLLERYYTGQIARHGLTIIDSIWPHGFTDAVASCVDLWVVLGTERPDTITNAQKLCEELRANYSDKVWLAQNLVSDDGLKQDSGQSSWQIRLPRIQRPDEYRGELGRTVLSKVFAPLWQMYDSQRKPGLFG